MVLGHGGKGDNQNKDFKNVMHYMPQKASVNR